MSKRDRSKLTQAQLFKVRDYLASLPDLDKYTPAPLAAATSEALGIELSPGQVASVCKAAGLEYKRRSYTKDDALGRTYLRLTHLETLVDTMRVQLIAAMNRISELEDQVTSPLPGKAEISE